MRLDHVERPTGAAFPAIVHDPEHRVIAVCHGVDLNVRQLHGVGIIQQGIDGVGGVAVLRLDPGGEGTSPAIGLPPFGHRLASCTGPGDRQSIPRGKVRRGAFTFDCIQVVDIAKCGRT